MPSTRQDERARMDAYLRQYIAGSQSFYQLTPERMYNYIGIHKSTWYRRLRNPGMFTLYEIRKLVKRFGWTKDQVWTFIGGGE